jgi:iron(III) transport system permease protein
VYRWRPSVWVVISGVVLLMLAVFVAWPLLSVLSSSFRHEATYGQTGWHRLFAGAGYLEAVNNTLILGITATVTATVVGVTLAFIIARYEFPLKRLVAILPIATLVVPEIIVVQVWLMLLGNNGVVTRSAAEVGIRLPSIYGWTGLIGVMTFIYYTYVYMGTLAAIQGCDAQLEEAAQSLGTSPAKSRLLVIIPAVWPAIVASALLAFTQIVGDFTVAALLSHDVELLSVLTYTMFVAEEGADPTMQSALASISMVIVVAALVLQRHVASREREMTQGRAAVPVRLRGIRSAALTGLVSVILLISSAPLIGLVIGAFTLTHGPVMYWGQFSLESVRHMLGRGSGPLLNSLTFGAIATVIGLVCSVVIGYVVVRRRNFLSPALDYLTMLPLAVSGTVLGIGLEMTFSTGWLAMTGTGTIIVVAYVIRRLPFGIRNASATLYNIPGSLEEASISLGVAPLETFVKVILPLMAPAIAAAAVVTWTTTVAELSASIVVYSAGYATAPIEILRLIDTGLAGRASAYGLALVFMTLIPILVAAKWFKLEFGR